MKWYISFKYKLNLHKNSRYIKIINKTSKFFSNKMPKKQFIFIKKTVIF
jgi:hypothetical protein